MRKKNCVRMKIDWTLLIIGIIIFSIIFFKTIQIGLKQVLAQENSGSLVDIFRKNLSQSRIKANEEVAVVNCKIIHYACWAYYSVWREFPSTLKDLGEKDPPFIKPKLARATVAEDSYQGYFYIYESSDPHHFILISKPKEMNVTGQNIFFVDDSGKVRLDDVDGTIIAVADKP